MNETGEDDNNDHRRANSLPTQVMSAAEQEEQGSNSTHEKKSLSLEDEHPQMDTTSPSDETDELKRQPTLAQRAMSRSRRASVPDFLKPDPRVATTWGKVKGFLSQELNFYRVHVLTFTITPLIFSGLFYAWNPTEIAYIDCLFVCVSAMTVTGLTTINVSVANDWQQAILFFLMCIGNLSAVSVTMVLIRRHFFRLKFDDVIKKSAKARKRMKDVEEAHQLEKKKEFIRFQKKLGLRKGGHHDDHDDSDSPRNETSSHSSDSTEEQAEAEMKAEKIKQKKDRIRKKQQGPLRADMIRRMDEPAVLINSAGMPSTAVQDRKDREESPTAPQGGILSTKEEAADSAGNTVDGPDLRFALPLQSPQSARRGSITASPEEIKEDPLRRGSISYPKRVIGEEADGSPDVAEDAQSPSSHRHPQHTRARFDDGSESIRARNRSGSDPASRIAAMHKRTGSDGGGMHTPHRATVDAFPRTQTIEFSEPVRDSDRRLAERHARSSALNMGHHTGGGYGEAVLKHRPTGLEFERTPTSATGRSGHSRRPTAGPGFPLTRTQTTAKERGFGGFPTPIEIAGDLIERHFPKIQKQFSRSMTMPRSATFTSTHSFGAAPSIEGHTRSAPYLSFDATVTRNSRFQELTEVQREELGGVEYRAIDLLAIILPAYWFIFNFFFVLLVAPWLASSAASRVHQVLDSQGINTPDTTWMWFFQVVSAYSNTGLSLIDTSMIELPSQYFMLIPMGILILAGNTAFPICLRFFIWGISLVVPRRGRMYETLRFLLDHPRRCFVYLFPSGQTWFLLVVLVVLNCTDWVFFQILDIGNSTIESWSVGQRIFDGLFQSIAVRAAGFQIISLSTLAPAVQFLYIVMMYISAYPIAMSVRNTNVYEERSLGVYNEETSTEAAEPQTGGARVWGTYLASHARKQLAFDIWWLGFSLWLICIIEKSNIEDPASNGWFTVFSCLFELTSAYGTVGLSTGTPYDNFSLSGRFSTLGKLVVIAVMVRGRHRGLPVAIDRAVLLPGEMEIEDEVNDAYTMDEEVRSRTFASGAFPRTPTGMSVPNTPRMARAATAGAGGARGVPTVNVESYELDEHEGGTSMGADETSPTQARGYHHYPHLAAIEEAAASPSLTPMGNNSRISSYNFPSATATSKEIGNDDNPTESRSSSPSQHSSPKGKEREKTEEGGFLGGVTMDQLPSNAVDSEDEERRLDQLDHQYQERYGTVTDSVKRQQSSTAS